MKEKSYYPVIHDFFSHSNYEASRRFTLQNGYSPEPLKSLVKERTLFPSATSYIHIAGTLGKGSVATYLYRMIQREGHSCGLYTSPHLIHPCERIQLNGVNIPERELYKFFRYFRMFYDLSKMSYFDFFTLSALEYFREKNAGWAVLETGLGGRLDSTNVVQPAAVVLTSIAMDHETILGDTLEKIAWEKAGIIKSGTPVFSVPQKDEARGVIDKAAQDAGSPVHYFPESLWDQEKTYLQRNYSFSRWVFLKLFGFSPEEIPPDIPGRLEILRRDPLIIYDAAHNPASMENLAHEILRLAGNKNIDTLYIIMNSMKERDMRIYRIILDSILGKQTRIQYFLFPMRDPRFFSEDSGDSFPALSATLFQECNHTPGKNMFLFTGSMYLYKNVLSFLKDIFNTEISSDNS